jgi:nucleoside-diphosphate-sugar epimerase
MNILVTGGNGYVGNKLIPRLLDEKHRVFSIDINWFGDHLIKHKNLTKFKCDIKNIDTLKIKKIDCIIHLASISNDPMAEIDKNLSWETSALGTMQLMNFALKKKIKRIIYASSGSVYGIKKEKEVTENLSLRPISLYNKVKMVTERVILSYKKEIETFIVRPATVCGYSRRMRFDVSVNALALSALKNSTITVNGGSQIRPNIHINDMVDLYLFFLKKDKKFCGVYNAGFENISIIELARKIKKIIPSKIVVIKKNFDPRSYRISSKKLLKIGFRPKNKVSDAVIEMKDKWEKKILKDNPKFHSIKWLKKIYDKGF